MATNRLPDQLRGPFKAERVSIVFVAGTYLGWSRSVDFQNL